MTPKNNPVSTAFLSISLAVIVGWAANDLGYNKGHRDGYNKGVEYTADVANQECDERLANFQDDCADKYMQGLKACEYTQGQDCELRIRVRENICQDDIKKAYELGKKSCTPKVCKVK